MEHIHLIIIIANIIKIPYITLKMNLLIIMKEQLKKIIKIISTLNKKDKYDIYGFCANNNRIFEECFNLYMTDNPSIIGIENIISNNKKSVKHVFFSRHIFCSSY